MYIRTTIFASLFICFLHFISLAQDSRVPAEWEGQETVWLTWFGQDRRDSVSCRVMEALQPQVKLILNVKSDSMKMKAQQYMANYKINLRNVVFAIDKHVDFFARDYVFFVKNKDEKLNVVCFEYSAYGAFNDIPMPEEEKKFGRWDERLAEQLNLPVIKSEFVFEGGGIEANGKGTLLAIKQMAMQRNPKKTIGEIEEELKRTLGARKIIWLEQGLIEDKRFPNSGPFYKNYFGGGANMHIDELCRFVDESTVALPFISKEDIHKSPVDSINYPMLEMNFKILQKATTADGKKIKIIRIPMPEIELLKYTQIVEDADFRLKAIGFKKGDTIFRMPAVSYCNFFVSNKVVLIPKYWMPGMPQSQKQKDEAVRKVFVKLFPGRQIIQIFARTVNRGGGGIHCMTHELPVSKQ